MMPNNSCSEFVAFVMIICKEIDYYYKSNIYLLRLRLMFLSKGVVNLLKVWYNCLTMCVPNLQVVPILLFKLYIYKYKKKLGTLN